MEMFFAYSDGRDFKPLKMIDHTNAFQNPGILQFAPPVDMTESEVDGVRRCWLGCSFGNLRLRIGGIRGRSICLSSGGSI